MTHNLKINSIYFEPVVKRKKTFEIRKNDRNYKVGDYICLNEWDPGNMTYTGRKVKGKIIYITDYEQKDNYIVFGFEFIEESIDQNIR